MELYHAVKNDQLVHIFDVERGRSCGCVCAGCREPLIAKKGKIRRHHFAHDNKDGCTWGPETALHFAAKEILKNAREVWIPGITTKFLKREEPLVKPGYISLDRVTLESPKEGFVPDAVIEHKGRSLIVEIKVTHGVDETKLSKIKSAGISALEIDLSRTPRHATISELELLILDENRNKRWLHNELATRKMGELKAKRGELKARSKALRYWGRSREHVEGCPIIARKWGGPGYANVMSDCARCKHSIDISEPYVYCLHPEIPPGIRRYEHWSHSGPAIRTTRTP